MIILPSLEQASGRTVLISVVAPRHNDAKRRGPWASAARAGAEMAQRTPVTITCFGPLLRNVCMNECQALFAVPAHLPFVLTFER